MTAPADWILVTMEEKRARRQGVPVRLPVPKADLETIAAKGMTLDQIRRWIRDFLAQAGRAPAWRRENAALAKSFDAFIAKTELLTRAEQAFAKSDFKGAISTLRMVTSVDPEDHATRMNLGSALANAGDHAGALAQLETIRATFAGEADYHLVAGQLQIALGKPENAKDELVLALEANPECRPAMDLLVKLGVLVATYEDALDADSLVYVRADGLVTALTAAWDAAPRDAAFFLRQADYHLGEGRAEVALAAADRAVSAGGAEPLVERARMARVAALRSLDRAAEARGDVVAAIARSAHAAWAHTELARFLMEEGEHDESRVELDRALAIDPGDQNALMLRFYPSEANDLGKMAAAIPALAAFAEQNATHAGAWRALARAKAAIGMDDEALALFAKGAVLAPEDDALRAEYWAHLERLRKFDALLADAGALTNLGARDWKLRFSEAEAFRALGKRVEARAALAALNRDVGIPVEARKRAKRAVMEMGDPSRDA